MNQLDIYCFTSIARTRSFSITAKELMISQQAVSNHIKALEEETGYILFFRSGQSATLTKAGEILLDFFIKRDELLKHFYSAHPPIQENPPLRIAWSQWTGCTPLLEEILQEYREKHPEDVILIYDLPVAAIKEKISNKEIDLLFASSYASDYIAQSWDHLTLCTQEILLVQSKRIQYETKELSLYPFFTIPAGENNSYTTIERARETCSRIGFSPMNVQICDDLGSAFLNVLTMNGLTFGTHESTRRSADNFILTPTGIFFEYVMCAPFYSSNPVAARFRNFIKEKISQIPHREEMEALQ